MLPVESTFPNFVNNQLLTAGDLNQLFGYLDGQNRLTRINLLGIGIVCGLHIRVSSDFSAVTISKGCAVTSAGFLVTHEETVYTQRRLYNVDTEYVYEKFKIPVGDGESVPIKVWELLQEATVEDSLPVDKSFLENKVILIFVELKHTKNKNCDPQSCDDKGEHVTVSFLPMAVEKKDAEKYLLSTTAGVFGKSTYKTLPEVRMPAWDVPNTKPVFTNDVLKAYISVFEKAFIEQVAETLQKTYNSFAQIFEAEFATNPFAGFTAKYKFLYEKNLSPVQMLHLQYYYDFFSDLLQAYQELRIAGTRILGMCCPDHTLFPRHILLGEAKSQTTEGIFPLRHYFIYSPLFDQHDTLNEIRCLFRRLVLMDQHFNLPAVLGNNQKVDTHLRITPSSLGDYLLSEKSIPYYYHVNTGSRPLYLHWNYQRTQLSDAGNILSYHADKYHTGFPGDFVLSPLKYDIEPYNFLRVEGIVGKHYLHVLTQVKQHIRNSRLPVDIIALSTDDAGLWKNEVLQKIALAKDAGDMICHFQDLESMYDSIRKELLCTLCKELRYYYDFFIGGLESVYKNIQTADTASTVELFDACAKGYKVRRQTFGAVIEHLHRLGLTDETLNFVNFFQAFGFNFADENDDSIPDEWKDRVPALMVLALNLFKIPLGIIRMSSLLAEDLSDFEAGKYCTAADAVAGYAQSLKSVFSIFTGSPTANTLKTDENLKTNEDNKNITHEEGRIVTPANEVTNVETKKAVISSNTTNRALLAINASNNGLLRMIVLLLAVEDFLDHLDVLIYNCKCGALLSLKRDYLVRYKQVARLRQFGYFTSMHPGIRHKAGVPVGGTFIVVYHAQRQSKLVLQDERNDFTNKVREEKIESIRTFLGKNMVEEKEERFSVRNKPTLIAGKIEDETGEAMPGVKVFIEETNQGTITNAGGFFKITSQVIPFTLRVEVPGYEKFIKKITQSDDGLLITLQPVAEEIEDLITPGIVFADFYLPYRCCSDCPPVQFIVNEKPPAEKPNAGPRADAGPDQEVSLPVRKVTLNGSASTDPDGSITLYQWAKLSGPGNPVIVTHDSAVTDVIDLEEGVYFFELSVTDDKGAIGRDTVIIKVLKAPPEPNTPPVADAGEDREVKMTGQNPVSVLLDGTKSTDKEGPVAAYQWKQESGPATAVIQLPDAPASLALLPQPGKYVFKLTVTDAGGLSHSDEVTIVVERVPNQPPLSKPEVAGSPIIVLSSNTTASATLIGSNSVDPEGGSLVFNWSVKSSPAGVALPVITNPSSAVTSVSGLQFGNTVFELKVTDPEGASGVEVLTINVVRGENKAPTANAGQNRTVIFSGNPITVTLDGSASSDPENLPLIFSWRFAGGATAAQPVIADPDKAVTQVSGLVTGNYSFELKVTDQGGLSDVAKVVITVEKGESPSAGATCGPLSSVVSPFTVFERRVSNGGAFGLFAERFRFYPMVSEYFKELSTLADEDIPGHMKFFGKSIQGALINDWLIQWINELVIIIENHRDVRQQAFTLYQIFLQLAFYIACIQPQDIDKQKLSLEKLFDLIRRNAEQWAKNIQAGLFNANDQKALKLILDGVRKEVDKMDANGTSNTKTRYREVLLSILKPF